MTSLRLRLEWWAMLALCLAGLWALHSSGATGRLDSQVLDLATTLSAPEPSPDIVLLTVDDHSLRELGAWPWPRALHARVVDRLTAAGARAVILDFLMPDTGDPQDLSMLADAMARSGKVYLPHTFVPAPNTPDQLEPLLPATPLREQVAGMGHVVANPDPDGVLRRFDLSFDIGADRYPHLARVVAEQVGTRVADPADTAPVVPMLPVGSYQQLPVAEFLAESGNAGFVRDKIVLVGAVAQGMGDQYSVASGPVTQMSGVETQANLLNALLGQKLVYTLPEAVSLMVGGACLAILFTGFWFMPPRRSLYLAIALVGATFALSVILVMAGKMWFAPGAALVMIVLAYPLWSWRRLSGLSRYIEGEIAWLGDGAPARPADGGLDFLARLTSKFQHLIRVMRQSLDFVERVIEASPDAMLVLDRDGRIVRFNSRARALFAGDRNLEGVTFVELLLLAKIAGSDQGRELVTEDGRTFLLARADLAPASNHSEADQPRAGEIVSLREVTHARRLEEERRHMLEFLSHDMRTPQAAIIALTRQIEGATNRAETAQRIRTQAQRTLKLADDFVQLARLGQAQIKLEECDLNALVEEACDRAFASAESAGVEIRYVPSDDCLFVPVDGSAIARMLDNLIGNAIKYCRPGDCVTIALASPGEHAVEIVVADTGPGLPEERLADPFARFGAHATQAGPSVGLGLALVKKVVEVHRGTVTVDSAPGQGTRFTIVLPIRP